MTIEPQGVAEAVELAAADDPSNLVLILAMFLGLAAVRLAEAVVSKYITRADGSGATPWTGEDHHRLKVLHELHARYGPDGTPVWYSNDDPKAALRMAEDLRKLAEAQRDTLRIVERLDARAAADG